MIRLIVLAVITLLVLLLGSIVIAWLFVIIGDGWECRNEDKVGKEVSNG